MPLLKTKKIPKCNCGKEPSKMILYTDHMQARTILMFGGSLCLLLVTVISLLLLLEGDVDMAFGEMRDEIWILILLGYWLYIFYQIYRIKRTGHSLLCASRQAFIKGI